MSEKQRTLASTTTRRQFLSSSGVCGAALSLGLWSEVPAAVSKSPSEKLNIGAIGVGNRGEVNLSFLTDENIVALCDVDQNYLDQLAQHFPRAKQYADFRKLLDRTDLDAVIISTPDHTHTHAAVMAMRQGLHVYCERPLAHSIYETRLMAQLSREKKLVTQMGNQHHSSAGYRRAVELVQSGAIGQVREVHCWTNRPLWPQGMKRPQQTPPVPKNLNWDLWLGPAPWRPYHQAYLSTKWNGWWDFGGGALADMGPHLIDPVFWALKLTLPTTIEAESAPVSNETAPLWSMVRYQFPARGGLPPLKLSWYDGGKLPPQEVTGTDRPPSNGALLIGERANLFLPQHGGHPIVVARRKGVHIELPKPFLPVLPEHHQQWALACKTAGSTSSDFSSAALLTETCLLGNVAIRTGKKIQWNAQLMKAEHCTEAQQYLRRDYRTGWSL